MRLALVIEASQLVQLQSVQAFKVTKVGAGYVHRVGTDYRCRDCWLFIPDKERCASFSRNDVVKANGYCAYWEYGTPVAGLKSMGSYTPKQAGYGEDSNGTKCSRCKFFDKKGYCQKVDEESFGDDPGKIDVNACCANQEPK